MVSGIDECKMSSKRLIKASSFPGVTCCDMYHYLIPILVSYTYCPLLRNRNCWQIVGVEIIYCRKLPTKHIVISHPVTKTDSKHLAMKIGYIQLHLHKLEIDIIENGNANSNHQNSKGLHLNGKDVLQFTKNLIEGIWKLRY